MPSYWRGLTRAKRPAMCWTTGALARELGVPSASVRDMAVRGVIPAFRLTPRGYWRIHARDVPAILLRFGKALGRRAARIAREAEALDARGRDSVTRRDDE